jgi:hypothetical protein
MTHEQIETAKEAVEMLKLAHEYFDQACALLKDANLDTIGPRLPLGMHGYDARDLNGKLIPNLIEYVAAAAAEGGE